ESIKPTQLNELTNAWKIILSESVLQKFINKYSIQTYFKSVALGNKAYNECAKEEYVYSGASPHKKCMDDENKVKYNKKVSYLYVFTKIWNSILTYIKQSRGNVTPQKIFREFIFDLFNTYVQQYDLQKPEDPQQIAVDMNEKIDIAFNDFTYLIGDLHLSDGIVKDPIKMLDYKPPPKSYTMNVFQMLNINIDDIRTFVNSMTKKTGDSPSSKPEYSHPSSYPTLTLTSMPANQVLGI
ncbi:hypothetical protein EBV26_16055, partial [bacterium]|nr:hypothetical protein [bacterium]